MDTLSTEYCVISYTIDANDRIDSIGGDWERFASMNEASQLAPERVMGSSIWQCIDGIDTAEIHRLLFAGVRDRNLQITLPFRCDGPRLRRDMEMTVQPGSNGSIEIRTTTVREQARPYVALLDASARRSNELIKVCSWCKKVKLRAERWVDVEQAIQEMRLLEFLPLPRISHGMCESCLAAFREQIEQGKPA